MLQLLSLVSVLFLLLIGAFCAARQYAQWLMAESTLELGQNNLLLAKSRLEEHFSRLGSLAAVLSYSPTTEQYLMQDSLSRLQSAEDLSAVFANTLLLEESIRSISSFFSKLSFKTSRYFLVMGTLHSSKTVSSPYNNRFSYYF